MATTEQVTAGVIEYAEKEILTKLEGTTLWLAAAALALAYPRANAIITALVSTKTAAMLGLVDSNGEIDVDAAIEAMKATVKKYGKPELDLPMIGKFKFGESDFDVLRGYINGAE